MTVDLNTRIETTEPHECVFVDRFDDDQMWLSIRVKNGSAYCTLTFEQARQVMEAMERVLAHQKVEA